MILRICTIILGIRHNEIVMVGGHHLLIKCGALALHASLHALRNVLGHELAVLLVPVELLDFFAVARPVALVEGAAALLENRRLLVAKR